MKTPAARVAELAERLAELEPGKVERLAEALARAVEAAEELARAKAEGGVVGLILAALDDDAALRVARKGGAA